jgi:hypothetical protein
LFSVYPPTDGGETTTVLVDDAASKIRYGIYEKAINAGPTTDANAEFIRDVFLYENSLPKSRSQMSIQPGNAEYPTVVFDCIGLAQFFSVYPYSYIGNTVSSLSDKIIDIINADPNHVFSTNYDMIEPNLYAVTDMEIDDRYAWDVIQALLSLGDAVNDYRAFFGVYEDGRAEYKTQPQDIKYSYRLSDRFQAVNNYGGRSVVMPWDVRPAYWIVVPDFLIGRHIQAVTVRSDPRNKFIEGVTYSAPLTVELECGGMDRLAQILAKITYTGGIY